MNMDMSINIHMKLQQSLKVTKNVDSILNL